MPQPDSGPITHQAPLAQGHRSVQPSLGVTKLNSTNHCQVLLGHPKAAPHACGCVDGSLSLAISQLWDVDLLGALIYKMGMLRVSVMVSL